MPDNNGNYTLPPGYFATRGTKVLTSQHNPILEDMRDAMNRRLMTTGDNPMTGDLPMGGKKITGLADPAAAQDGATKAYVDGEVTGLSNSLGTAATVDHGTDPGEAPLNSDLGSMAVEDAADYVTKASKATQGQAEGGVTGDVWMDDIRVRQAIAMHAIGEGQTWVDVLASRAFDTWYQNTTGRSIFAAARGNGSSYRIYFLVKDGLSGTDVEVPGSGVASGTASSVASVIVPDGWYYRLEHSGSPTLTTWAELR